MNKFSQIPATTNVGGGMVGTIGSAINNAFSFGMQDMAFDQNLKMWHLENEYNHPAKQMQRFREAGLNPNLMFGSVNSGNSTGTPTYEAPRTENPFSALGEGISMSGSSYVNTLLAQQQSDANVDKIKAEADLIRSQIPKTDKETKLTEEKTKTQEQLTIKTAAEAISAQAHANVAPAIEAITLAQEEQKLSNLSTQEKEMLSNIAAKEAETALMRENITTAKFMRQLERAKYNLAKHEYYLKKKIESARLSMEKWKFEESHELDTLRARADAQYKEYELTVRQNELMNKIYEFGVQHGWEKRKYLYDTFNPTSWFRPTNIPK